MRTVLLAMALAACATDGELSERVCRPITDTVAWGRCMGDHMDRLEAQRKREENEELLIAPLLLNRPIQTTCMNIGGIITCTSR